MAFCQLVKLESHLGAGASLHQFKAPWSLLNPGNIVPKGPLNPPKSWKNGTEGPLKHPKLWKYGTEGPLGSPKLWKYGTEVTPWKPLNQGNMIPRDRWNLLNHRNMVKWASWNFLNHGNMIPKCLLKPSASPSYMVPRGLRRSLHFSEGFKEVPPLFREVWASLTTEKFRSELQWNSRPIKRTILYFHFSIRTQKSY